MDYSIPYFGCPLIGFQSKIKNRMVNSVDTDEMAHYEPSHLDLHCYHRYLFWSTGLKGLNYSTETCLVGTH